LNIIKNQEGDRRMFKETEGFFEGLRRLHLQAERHFFTLLAPHREGKWQPQADIYETDEAWVIKLELAGVGKEDFSLFANKGILTIKGTRKDEFAGEGRTYHQAEINYNEFERSFPLPQGADEEAIKALYKDGLLTITIMKRPPSSLERKTITITIL
jgi:HSP20 family protein